MSGPPLFSKFGKSTKDLLTKKFDFHEGHKIKTTTSDGSKFETTLTQSQSGFDGSVLFKRDCNRLGKCEVEVSTKGPAKVKVDVNDVYKNTKLTVKADERPSGSVSVEYNRDSVAVEAGVSGGQKGTSVNAGLSIGADGFSVGGAAVYDVSSSSVVDMNYGIEYAGNGYTATMKSSDRLVNLTTSYHHIVNPNLAVGGLLKYDLHSNQRDFAVGAEYTLDASTKVKSKIQSNGTLTSLYERKLPNQSFMYTLLAVHDLHGRSSAPTEYGLKLTLGDTD